MNTNWRRRGRWWKKRRRIKQTWLFTVWNAGTILDVSSNN